VAVRNEFIVLRSGNVKIRLPRKSGPDMWTFVEGADFDIADSIPGTWTAYKGNRTFYVSWNKKKIVNGRRTADLFILHRMIMGLPQHGREPCVDHLDHDGLNNRRSNLMVVSQQRNKFRRRTKFHSKSKHRNVYWHKNKEHWIVSFNYKGVKYHCGCFRDEEKAARIARRERRRVAGYEA
jgi:hypothetical protein